MANVNTALNYILMPTFSIRLTHALYCIPLCSSFWNPQKILLHLDPALSGKKIRNNELVYGIPGIEIRQGLPERRTFLK